jgi:hypothetical protein
VLLPFVVETCGGLATDAVKLLDVMSQAGHEHLSLWSHAEIVQHILGSVAVAIQKGNAMTVLAAHTAAVVRASAAHGEDGE